MAFTSITWDGDGVTYSIPGQGDTAWSGTLKVDGLLISLARNAVSKTGAQTVTNKTITSPAINGGTITSATLVTPTIATIVNTGTLTLPTSTDTLVGKATTDVLTNKSIDASQLTGTIAAGRMPALTGDVTSSAGSVATTLAATANATLVSLDKSSGVAIHGTNTNDAAAAGYVGEDLTSTVLAASAVSLSSGNAANVTSQTLNPGDYLIGGAVGFITAGTTTITQLTAAVSTSSATMPTEIGAVSSFQFRVQFNCASFTPGATTATQVIPLYRVTVAASTTTTFYLVARANFGTSTCTACGSLIIRRAR